MLDSGWEEAFGEVGRLFGPRQVSRDRAGDDDL